MGDAGTNRSADVYFLCMTNILYMPQLENTIFLLVMRGVIPAVHAGGVPIPY